MKSTELITAYNQVASQQSKTLKGYFEWLVIDSETPSRFKSAAKPFQWELVNLLGPLFEAVSEGKPLTQNKVYITAGRGSSKTSLLAMLLNWALNFSKRKLMCYGAAADLDQARLLLQRMKAEAQHNPYLKLHFRNYHVTGPTGELTILSSDAPTSSGLLGDVYVIDEVTYWKKPDLFDMLFSGSEKRTNSLFLIISNSGNTDSWQFRLWQLAVSSPRWLAYEVPAFSADWMNLESIKEQEKILIPAQYKKLHLNRWISLAEDCGYVSKSQMLSCVNHELSPRSKGDYPVAVGIDVGLVNDASVVSVVGYYQGCFILQDYKIWRGTPQNPVKIQAIEDHLLGVMKNFDVRMVYVDPYELRHLIQKFETKMPIEAFYQTTASLYKLAENFRALVRDRQFQIYPQAAELIEEVSKLYVEERNGGLSYRVQHVPGEHNDIFCATSLALMALVEMKAQLEVKMSVIQGPAPQPAKDWSKWVITG